VHRRHDPPRLVSTDGYEAEVERTAQFTDLREGRADREVRVFSGVVIGAGGEGGDGAVACVSWGGSEYI
jgi:hypothetical protein